MTQPDSPSAGVQSDRPQDASTTDGPDIRVKIFARTDVGQIREHNEDNFLVADMTRKSRGLLDSHRAIPLGARGSLFAVCDGMGGAAAGEIASQLAVDILYERMIEGQVDAQPLSRDELARRLVRAIEAAGLRIFQDAKLDRAHRGMGTTVTAAALVDDYLFFAQVGDSRGYILRRGQLSQMTRDQSLVNQLIEAGQLTEEEAETFEHNNIILQALGTSDTVQVDLTFCELRRGDVLLLCSDGLSGMVRFEDIREVLRTTPEPLDACKLLTERANQAGGHDNITVIVAQFDGERLKALEGEEPPPKYRKYVLPEESDLTEPHRRLTPDGYSSVPAQARNSSPPQGLGSTVALDEAVAPRSSPLPSLRSSRAPGADGTSAADDHEERIEIPGTHVPPWVVVVIVVAVILVLGGTAFLLLG